MMGDMFGEMEERQKDLKEKLRKVELSTQAGGGAVSISVNANRDITGIEIDRDKIDVTETGELEEILLVGINDALDKAEEKEREESKKMLQELLPPGMGGLSDLFT